VAVDMSNVLYQETPTEDQKAIGGSAMTALTKIRLSLFYHKLRFRT